jgi:hypothetical protein
VLFFSLAFAEDPTPPPKPKGFTITDASGKNSLTLGLSFQPRFTTTLNGDPEASPEEAFSDTGFRIRRMLFTANGSVAGFLDYKFRINTASSVLDDAQVVARLADPFNLSFGQWKVPFTASQMMSDTTLLFPDRPLPIDGFKYGDVKLTGFSWSRDAGAAVLGTAAEKKLEYQLGVFNGDGSNVWPAEPGFLYTARLQLSPLGEFKYDEVDFERGKPRLALGLGAAAHTIPSWTDSGDPAGTTLDLRTGGELRFAVAGLSINGEVLYGTVQPADSADPTRSLGVYGQLGYYLPIGIAPGIRFARMDPSLDTEEDGLSQVEGVLSWYLPDRNGGNLAHKAQLQLGWITSLQDGLDHPLSHQAQLAMALTY